jgi:type II secretory pathway predicted ATPase ExeA
LRWADAVICVLTADFAASPWCSAEVGIAQAYGCKIIPLAAEGSADHPLLGSIQHIAFTAGSDGDARSRLIEALREVDATGGYGWPADRSPFPGLAPFSIVDRRVFFGRSAEVHNLVRELRSSAERADQDIVVVVGPSGCGKSSMVRAGLLPALSDEPHWWALQPVLPGADPLGALARELASAARLLDLRWTVHEVRRTLKSGGLAELVDEILVAAPGPRRRERLLLVVDQFEELATRAGAMERALFAEALQPALGGSLQIVATLRPEFLEPLLASPELRALRMRTSLLRPLSTDNLATVIREPARLAGIDVDDDLISRLVGDTESGEALPLLAYTLAQLCDGVSRGGHLSARRYEQLGGVKGALTSQADHGPRRRDRCRRQRIDPERRRRTPAAGDRGRPRTTHSAAAARRRA